MNAYPEKKGYQLWRGPGSLAFVFLPVPGQDPELAAQLRYKVIAAITPRELEFLLHAADPEEHTYEAIAYLMGVSEDRVNDYRKALFDKFSIKSKPGLVLFAHAWHIAHLGDHYLRHGYIWMPGVGDQPAAAMI